MTKGENFTFEIKEHLGVIAVHSTGWKREVNIVEWNGNDAKVDIRDWNPSHESMSKGVALYKAEAKKLFDALNNYFSREDNIQREVETKSENNTKEE